MFVEKRENCFIDENVELLLVVTVVCFGFEMFYML